MKDKDEVQYVFGQDGYLRQIKDTYGNAMKCQYGPNSAGIIFSMQKIRQVRELYLITTAI